MLTTSLLAVVFLASGGPVVSRAVDGIPPEPKRIQALSNDQVQLAALHDFNIPAGSLRGALIEFAKQGGVQVFFNDRSVGNRQTPGLKGRMTADQALKVLLAGTKLTPSRVSTAEIVVAQAVTGRASDGEIQLDTVVVEGEVISRTVQETPTSVTVIKGDRLDGGSETSIEEIFAEQPNITSSTGGLAINIRGIDSIGVGGAGSNLVIDLNVDGASYVTAQGQTTGAKSTWDLEQVEILRGPQSTQQGNNALAGAVRIRSKDPTFEPEFKFRGDFGSYFENRLAGALNVPLIDNVLALRISAERFRTDGFINNPTLNRRDFSDRRLDTVRAKLRFQPTEIVDLIFGYTFSDNRIGTANINESANGKALANFSNVPSFEEAQNHAFNFRSTFELPYNWTLKTETTYFETDYIISADADGTAANNGQGARVIQDKSLAQEARLSYSNDRLDAVIGVYYNETESDVAFDASFPFPPPAPPGTLATNSSTTFTEAENLAFFGEIDWRFAPRFRLIAGARFDREDSEVLSAGVFSVGPPINTVNITPTTLTTFKGDVFLPKAGLIYNWTDDISTGFTWQRGFRAGGSGASPAGSFFTFDAEFTDNYEVAFRSQWLDNQLTLNANFFYTLWKDQQVSIQGPLGVLDGQVTNAGKSELYGFEVDSRWQVNDNLNVRGAIGYSHTEFLDFTNNTMVFDGNRFPQAPEWTGSIGGTYTFDNGVFIEALGKYTGSAFNDAANTAGTLSDDRFIVDAKVGYSAEAWSAHVFARNLFDTRYVENRRLDAFSRVGEPLVVGGVVRMKL